MDTNLKIFDFGIHQGMRKGIHHNYISTRNHRQVDLVHTSLVNPPSTCSAPFDSSKAQFNPKSGIYVTLQGSKHDRNKRQTSSVHRSAPTEGFVNPAPAGIELLPFS